MKGKRLINSHNNLYGAYQCTPKFHRYTTYKPSADEGQNNPETYVEKTVMSSLYSNLSNQNLNIYTDINTITFIVIFKIQTVEDTTNNSMVMDL